MNLARLCRPLAIIFLFGSAFTARGEIPANTWERLEPDPCTGALCSSAFPEKRGYSGPAVGGGYLWYWGGAHKTHPGNDIDAYDISKSEWVQFTSMEDWTNYPEWNHLTAEEKQDLSDAIGGGGSPPFLSPKGRLLTSHSYARHAWDPVNNRYCELKDGLWCYDPEKGDEWGTMAESSKDPTQPDGAWSEVTDTFPGASGCDFFTELAWDPSRDTFALFSGCTSSGYLLEDGEWIKKASGFPWKRFSEIYAVYVPPWDDWLVLHKRILVRVDLDTGSVKKITPPPDGTGTFSVSMEWSPEIARVLYVAGNEDFSTVRTYDPVTDSWGELFLDGQPPGTGIAPRWDNLNRDPKTGRYWVLSITHKGGSHISGDVWTFRLSSDALTKRPEPCPVDACVGPGFEYSSIEKAVRAVPDKGTVGLADAEFRQCAVVTKSVTIRPIAGRPHVHGSICDGKGVFVVKSTGRVTIEGLEISGATGEKAIWLHNGAGTLVLDNLVIHDSGMGVFGAKARRIELYDSVLYGMKDRDELAHFIYGAELDELVVEGNYLHGGTDGHFIKAASTDVTLRYNYVRNTVPTDAALVDVWGCGVNRIVGNVLYSEHTSFGNAIRIHNRGDGTPGPPYKACPVEIARVVIAYNSYLKRGGRNTSFASASYDGAASATEELRLRMLNNMVAVPPTGGKLFYDTEDASSRYPDNQFRKDPGALFEDEFLRAVQPAEAADGVAVPPLQYAHPATTEKRTGPATMGAYGRPAGDERP